MVLLSFSGRFRVFADFMSYSDGNLERDITVQPVLAPHLVAKVSDLRKIASLHCTFQSEYALEVFRVPKMTNMTNFITVAGRLVRNHFFIG